MNIRTETTARQELDKCRKTQYNDINDQIGQKGRNNMGKADREVLAKRIAEGEERERQKIKKEKKEKIKKEKVSFWQDFKKFVTRGNVLDLAVAVVIANAFNAIVTGLVKNVITPFVTYFTSGVSINEWEWVLRQEVLNAEGKVEIAKISVMYGLWLQTIIDFIIIAFSIFVAVRIVNGMRKKLNRKEEDRKAAEEAKKKEEAKAAEAKAKEEAERKAATEAEFYANVKEQSALLRDIKELLKK